MAAGSEGARAGCAPRGAAGRVTCPGGAPPPRRNSPGLCNSPAGAGPAARSPAVPRLHAGPQVAPTPGHPRGFNLVPAARQPRPCGPAEGSDGRSCSHLRSRRLACSHLLGLSSAGVTTTASSCDITFQGVCGHRRRPLSRPYTTSRNSGGGTRPGSAASPALERHRVAPAPPSFPLLSWHKHLDLVRGYGWLPDCQWHCLGAWALGLVLHGRGLGLLSPEMSSWASEAVPMDALAQQSFGGPGVPLR